MKTLKITLIALGLLLPCFALFAQDLPDGTGEAPEDALSPVLHSDGSLAAAEMTLDMARCLAEAGPWGQQFPMPAFHDTFDVVSQRVVGERHLKLVLKKADRLESGNRCINHEYVDKGEPQ